MKNKMFMKKTAGEKRQYLSAVLKHASGGTLGDRMIGHILLKVSIHEQYAVAVFSAYPAFLRAVAHTQSGKVRASTVYSRTGDGAVAVVITPLKSAGTESIGRIICIYAPTHASGKGCKNG